MTFQLTGLPAESFAPYFAMSEADLLAEGAEMLIADNSDPGFPCRVSLQHATPGERVLLLNYAHLPVNTPYRSAHAIFVAETSAQATLDVNEVPAPLLVRTLSVRAFDKVHMMIDADVVEGRSASNLIERFFTDPATDYIHIHYAKRGCYAAKAVRA